MDKKALFELANDSNLESVQIVSANAGDNAALMVGVDNRFDVDGNRTDAFYAAWFASVEALLCVDDADQEAVVWFKSNDVNF